MCDERHKIIVTQKLRRWNSYDIILPMALSLAGKYVLVTGATDGLGKALTGELAKQGANLIIHGRNKIKLKEVADELKKVNASIAVKSILCDLSHPDSVKKFFSRIKKLDVLINNAGMWLAGNTVSAHDKKIIELVNTNLLASLLITQAVISTLLQSDFGQIMNVVSRDGVEISSHFFAPFYSATKFGMQGFTESLAREFYNKNLRVMGYYPGGMQTNIFKKAGDKYTKEPWMFSTQESVEAIIFMLTRGKKINVKRMDLVNQKEG